MAIGNRQDRRVEFVRCPAVGAADPEIGPPIGKRLGNFLVGRTQLRAFGLETRIGFVGERQRLLQREDLRARAIGGIRYHR